MNPNNRSDPFQIGVGDRILLSMISICVLFMSVFAFWGLMHWAPDDTTNRILKILILEGSGALIIFSAAALLYAISKAQWLKKVIMGRLVPVFVSIFFLLGIVLYSIFYVILHD